jgi:thioredoxin 2
MTIVTCPNCGAKNRIDETRAKFMQPICGQCKAKLEISGSTSNGHPLEISDATFERDVLNVRGKPVLLDCWAPWCGPCRMIAPAIEQLATQAGGRYVVGKLNVDQNPTVASRFDIRSIPTLLIFKDGRVVDQIVGLLPGEAIRARVERFV